MGNSIYTWILRKTTNRKRKYSKENENDISIPKRFRSTFDYLYQKHFIEGDGSDITIMAFGKCWHLHKMYISQSPFFSTMFSGSWIEDSQCEIELQFTDPNINSDSLHIVFGSFYYDSMSLTELNAVSVLATSIWFQLKELSELCQQFIVSNLRFDNIVDFFEIGEMYNLEMLTNKCIEWLSSTLLLVDDSEIFYSTLQSISTELMKRIISNPRLFVIQVEEDVLLLLLKWIYLKVEPQPAIFGKKFVQKVREYFANMDLDKVYELEETLSLSLLFKHIRWSSIIGTLSTALSVLKLKLAPRDVLERAFRRQWLTVLHSAEWPESVHSSSGGGAAWGPPKGLDTAVFWTESERCGRQLLRDVNTSWRWAGFRFGLDLVIRYMQRLREFYVVSYSSRHYSDCSEWLPYYSTLSSPTGKRRRIQIHVTVASVLTCLASSTDKSDEQMTKYPKILQTAHSGIINIELTLNQPVKLMTLPQDFHFPLILSANILRYDPTKFIDNIP